MVQNSYFGKVGNNQFQMFNKSFLTEHPQLYKKVNTNSSLSRSNYETEVNLDKLTEQFIYDQVAKIKDLQLKIKVYQIKVEEEKNNKIDYQPQIKEFQRQIQQIREEEKDINQQIKNCQLVENQVTPMEYYLWKKKQRVNTYDASIAELCRQVQKQRDYLERVIEEHRKQNEEIISQIEQLQQKINNLNSSPRSSANLQEGLSSNISQQQYQDIFASNINLKEQYTTLLNTNQILQQNKEIVGMQVIDNIESIEATLRSYYDTEKIKLIKQFKQIQLQSKNKQISPLNTDDQNYKIEPLINDYAYKLKQIYNSAPEQIKKVIYCIVQPLPWDKFNWREFVQIQPKSQQIYNQYRQLQNQYMRNEAQTQKLQSQLKNINNELASEQQKNNQISINIIKMKKKLDK